MSTHMDILVENSKTITFSNPDKLNGQIQTNTADTRVVVFGGHNSDSWWWNVTSLMGMPVGELRIYSTTDMQGKVLIKQTRYRTGNLAESRVINIPYTKLKDLGYIQSLLSDIEYDIELKKKKL